MIEIYDFILKSNREIFSMNNEFGLQIELPKKCPLCRIAVHPEILNCLMIDPNDRMCVDYNDVFAKVSFYCVSCKDVFLANYNVLIEEYTQISFNECYYPTQLIDVIPKKFKEEKFDDAILQMSPNFAKIYNQALYAELMNLDEISGISYRKSLEFLIKDFAILLHPDKKGDISSYKMTVSSCINTYITDESIKQLARASTFLGNDQSHYQKRHGSKDLGDFKKLIRALVHYINMNLVLIGSNEITSSSS